MEPVLAFDKDSTKDIAETTRRVLRHGAAWSVGERVSIGGRRSVAVELLADMDADDTTPKPAKLMELAGGSWRDTKQRVDVRNVGSTSLGSGTRCMAWPVANLGLCVAPGSGGGPMQTFNLGLMDQHQAALQNWNTVNGASLSPQAAIAGYHWLPEFPCSIMYDNLTATQLQESTFALNYKRPIDALCLGIGPAYLNSVPYIFNNGDNTAKAAAIAGMFWFPDPDSDNEAAIDLYLANGGTVLVFAEPPVAYETAAYGSPLSEVSAGLPARMNAWLEHVGSQTRMVPRADVIPGIATNFAGTLWANIPLLPLSGVVCCNPDTWLGRTKQMPRIFDETRVIQNYEFDTLRNARASQLNYYGNNGPWSGSSFFRADVAGNGFINLPPYTLSGEWVLTCRHADSFLRSFVGTDAWRDPAAFPTDTHQRSYYLATQLVEGIFQYRRFSDSQLEYRDIQSLPMATAERLPGGGKLIVTTKNALKWVTEALFRQGKSDELLDLTRHHRVSIINNFIDKPAEGRHVTGVYGQQFGRSLEPGATANHFQVYSTQYVKGDGITFTPKPEGSGANSGSGQTIVNPDSLPVQYLPVADLIKAGWKGVGGTSIWQRVATEVAIDTEYGYSQPDSAAPLALKLEPIRTFQPSDPVTLRVRAALCDSAGVITGSGGSCDLTIRIYAGSNNVPNIAMERTVSLTGALQTFEFVLTAPEITKLLTSLSFTQIEFVPASSGLGAALSWVSLETSAPTTFPVLSMHVDRRLISLVRNASLSPWFHTWKGVHPDFGLPFGGAANLSTIIAYPRAMLEAWGHFANGLIPATYNGAIPPSQLVGGNWYQGNTLSVRDIGASGITADYGNLVVQLGEVVSNVVLVTGSVARTRFPGFPVIYQNNRFLRPVKWTTKRDVAKYSSTGIGSNVPMWDQKRAAVSLKRWQDITNWPEIPDELVDIETGPESPPVCFGFGAEVEVPYGISAPHRVEFENYAAQGNSVNNFIDLVVTHSNAAVRAAWQNSYGGGP